MTIGFLLSITAFSLVGTFVLTALTSSIRCLHKKESAKELQTLGNLFFYRALHKRLLPNHEVEGILFSVLCAQTFSRLLFMGFGILFLYETFPATTSWTLSLGLAFFVLLGTLTLGELFPRLIANRYPITSLKMFALLASPFLLASFPISYFFLKCFRSICLVVAFDYMHEPQAKGKREILDIIRDADIDVGVDPADKELIQSVVHFRERIAKEVMVPRVDIFSLSSDTSIKDATHLLEDEGYSRIPVYRGTVDKIIGVLMYKDLLQTYMEYEAKGNDEKILNTSIETILKKVLYTPETKKISHLLQDFRKKQVHLAIVVDEYGGTEGIVTIEDILEEIVGEIEDEYDDDEDLIVPLKDGSWIVDAKINLIDLEDEIAMKLPQEGDYDTVGGYIYHKAGEIPKKGFKILMEDFKLLVVKSNERAVEKVRIVPITSAEKAREEEEQPQA